jgi:hypothetical protein
VRVSESQDGFGVRIVLGSSRMINYQQGGGHWAWFLRDPFGLRALGHDDFWIEFAASRIGAADPAGDHQLLREHGWRVADPHQVSASPAQYQQYILGSRAEFMCAKPIHVAMKNGWFSDRSIAYLASGRSFSYRRPASMNASPPVGDCSVSAMCERRLREPQRSMAITKSIAVPRESSPRRSSIPESVSPDCWSPATAED